MQPMLEFKSLLVKITPSVQLLLMMQEELISSPSPLWTYKTAAPTRTFFCRVSSPRVAGFQVCLRWNSPGPTMTPPRPPFLPLLPSSPFLLLVFPLCCFLPSWLEMSSHYCEHMSPSFSSSRYQDVLPHVSASPPWIHSINLWDGLLDWGPHHKFPSNNQMK